MASTNLARFTINATPSEDASGNRGYDAGAGETLAITLENNPALGVLTITYDLHDSSNPLSPLNSLYSSDLTFTENSARSYTTSSTNTTIHVTIPAGVDISSYTIRATAVTATGANVFERLVAVRKNGLRMTIPAESLQYAQRGWSDALNELTKLLSGGGVTTPLVSSSTTGIIAAFPAGSRRIFHSDGATAGGSWAALTKTDLDAALAAGSIDPAKVAPGTNGYVLRTNGLTVLWGADVTLNRPVSPTENGYVAVALNGDLDYILIGNAQLAADANITVSKLAPGTNGYYLRTNGTSVFWAADDDFTAPVNPTDDGKAAIASGGDFVYAFIANANIATNANIAVSKLATGTEGYVLTIISGVPTWAVSGGGGTNLPTSGDDDGKVAFANAGNLDYADTVKVLNVGTLQNCLYLAGSLYLSSTTAPTTTAVYEGLIWNKSGYPTWSTASTDFNLLRSDQPNDPADNSKVAIAVDGQLSYGYITNAQVAAAAAIAVSKLAPGTNGYVLTTTGGASTWAQITNTNVSASAAIAVSKLAAGTEGHYLRTSSGVPVWTSTLDGNQITTNSVAATAIAPGTAYYALVTNAAGTSSTWALLKNSNISSSAAIVVTKLALGATNSVLHCNGSVNAWSTTPTVASLTATSYLKTIRIQMDHYGSSEPAIPAANGAQLFTHNSVTKLKYYSGDVYEIGSYVYVS